MKKCVKLLNVIKAYNERGEEVHEFDMIDEAGLEISTFNAVKAYFLHKFDAHVTYTKKTKMYGIVVTPVDDQKTLDDIIAGN